MKEGKLSLGNLLGEVILMGAICGLYLGIVSLTSKIKSVLINMRKRR